MSTVAAGKSSRAQRRAAARRAARQRVQPVIVEPLASGQGKAIGAAAGHIISQWSVSCTAADAKATTAISISLPSALSSESAKALKVRRVFLWFGTLPSVSGTLLACLTQTQSTAADSFLVAAAIADSSKTPAKVAWYDSSFRGVTLGDFAADVSIYLYSSVALSASDVKLHLEVEHVEPKFNKVFTPVA